MRLATFIVGVMMVLMGVLSFAFYEQYWAPREKAETMLREAIMVSERNTPEATNESLRILTSLWAKYQKFPVANKALLHIGRAYERLGLNESALEKYKYLQENSRGLTKKDRHLVEKRIAHIQILRNYSDEAVAHLYNLLQKSNDKKFRSQIYTELGMLYIKKKNFKKALESLEIAIREDGYNKHATLQKAKVLRYMGKDDAVFNIYDNFLSYNTADKPHGKDIMYSYKTQAYGRGISYFKNRNYWQAIKYFNIVLKKFPNSNQAAWAHFWKGESYYALKRFGRAIQSYQKYIRVLSNGSKAPDAMFKIGESYFELQKFEIAAKYFSKLILRYPNSSLVSLAKEWKEQSENEILHRMRSSKKREKDSGSSDISDDTSQNNSDQINKNDSNGNFGASNKDGQNKDKKKGLTEL